MTQTVPAIAAAISDALKNPRIKIERLLFVELYINTAEPHAIAIDARKIRLPTNAAVIAAIQRVIPNT